MKTTITTDAAIAPAGAPFLFVGRGEEHTVSVEYIICHLSTVWVEPVFGDPVS
jgi:hypothetical protein